MGVELNVHALVDRQLIAGQSDGLAVEAGSEDDRVAALRAGDDIAERARPLIERVEDRQRAEDGATLEALELRAEPVPLGCQGTGASREALSAFGTVLGNPHGEHLLLGKPVCGTTNGPSPPARRPSAGQGSRVS